MKEKRSTVQIKPDILKKENAVKCKSGVHYNDINTSDNSTSGSTMTSQKKSYNYSYVEVTYSLNYVYLFVRSIVRSFSEC